jgi:hypothetical protein
MNTWGKKLVKYAIVHFAFLPLTSIHKSPNASAEGAGGGDVEFIPKNPLWHILNL